ncbi:hypothetical protein N7456_001115 [Penicillium angulare]|uniref:Protein kinase domain-containing protein n=1 Tax=Penicillium angulare TaxID=116970 RepID=A0A9W9GDT4_9EURO|nr:hypothetical protein N7456_001115 [Penicillium angulare]
MGDQQPSKLHRPEEPNSELLAISVYSTTWLIDGKIIRKLPRDDELTPINREIMIYDILGPHPRITECVSKGSDNDHQYVEMTFYPNGDLEKYRKTNPPTPELRSKWFKQILDSIVLIHSLGMIHSDLKLSQFLVDDNLDLRLGDFNASQCPGHATVQ